MNSFPVKKRKNHFKMPNKGHSFYYLFWLLYLCIAQIISVLWLTEIQNGYLFATDGDLLF